MFRIYAKADTPDKEELTLLFANLERLYRHKDLICHTPAYYNIRLKGCGVFALYIGTCRLTLGDMLRLWESEPWQRDGVYICHIVGSPLSGGNSCAKWSRKKGFFHKKESSFMKIAQPAWQIVNARTADWSFSEMSLADLLALPEFADDEGETGSKDGGA